MDLKRLIHRELGEGMTEEELAVAVKISVEIVADILSGKCVKCKQERYGWDLPTRYERRPSRLACRDGRFSRYTA
ncbi:MAG: hypothetical protein U0236_19025 [Nitrospira sp.]